MVRLTRIYTRTGDDGTTCLGDMSRVAKTALRVEAYGTVDEANAFVGLAVLAAREAGAGIGETVAAQLESVQHDLFDVGADLCTPAEEGEAAGAKLRVTPEQTKRLESLIDEHNAGLSSLTSFVLPGGTALAASLHAARTVVRRAERLTVALQDAGGCGSEPVRYLNRLSDLLFVMSRAANDNGGRDVLWKPGSNRG